MRQFGDLSKAESDLNKPMNGSCWPTLLTCAMQHQLPQPGHSATENDVRDEGGFSRKRLPGAGDGCPGGYAQCTNPFKKNRQRN